MNLSETCIRRPVLTTLITAAIIVFGIFAYRLLAVAALPAVDFPTIYITATLPGASAETMAASVAAPIERQLSTISGITSLTSLVVARHHHRSPSSSTSTATSTAPRSTCRPRSPWRSAACRSK